MINQPNKLPSRSPFFFLNVIIWDWILGWIYFLSSRQFSHMQLKIIAGWNCLFNYLALSLEARCYISKAGNLISHTTKCLWIADAVSWNSFSPLPGSFLSEQSLLLQRHTCTQKQHVCWGFFKVFFRSISFPVKHEAYHFMNINGTYQHKRFTFKKGFRKPLKDKTVPLLWILIS